MRNPVAKHAYKFNKPKRIEDKRNKKRIEEMEREARKIQDEYLKQYEGL